MPTPDYEAFYNAIYAARHDFSTADPENFADNYKAFDQAEVAAFQACTNTTPVSLPECPPLA